MELILHDVRIVSKINLDFLVKTDYIRLLGYFKFKFLVFQSLHHVNFIDLCINKLINQINLEEIEKDKKMKNIGENVLLILILIKMYLYSIETNLPEAILSARIQKKYDDMNITELYHDIAKIHQGKNKFELKKIAMGWLDVEEPFQKFMKKLYDAERKDEKMHHNFSFNSYFSATEPSHEKNIRFMSKIKSQNKKYNQLFRTLVSLEVK